MISLTYHRSDRSLCPLWFLPPPASVLCGSFHPPLGGMYLRIHFTHQTQESQLLDSLKVVVISKSDRRKDLGYTPQPIAHNVTW
ncbi:hypothetical protein EZJ55_01820 [Microcystis aeruginosa EAWAG127a]|uniref:Uncharacterized protein n=1 Tax=Microcystis aeruginosa EAWAG127a TaxID=2529855 RepID=A0A5J5LPP3_MICAE|nr:hypothetical protein EZJ55_01820 [Microcystis aeruginosa EAWAG127a]